MDRNNLPGLTPIWILVLVSILAVLVGLGGEIVSRGIYEFLKDFQGAIVGIIAFGIAYWAAKPVYQQLHELRRQSAVQTFEMLQRLAATIGAERKVVDDFRYHAAQARTFETQIKTVELSAIFIRAHSDDLKTKGERIEHTIDALKIARAHPWGNKDTWLLRSNLEVAAYNLRARVSRLNSELSGFRVRGENSSATWIDLTTEARHISLEPEVSAVNQAVAAYLGAIDVEITRLRPLMEKATTWLFD
jgi:hypothetical protein